MVRHVCRLLRYSVITVAVLVLIGMGMSAGFVGVLVDQAFRELPEPQSLSASSLVQDVQFLDRKRSPLARYRVGDAHRIVVPYAEFPRHLVDAVVASEDARFWQHEGLDPRGIGRAVQATVVNGARQGGSTIPQQLLKLTMLGGRPGLLRKVEEAMLVRRFDALLGKEGMLELYLNAVFLGHGNTGVESAARDLFGVSASALTLAESALLIGMIPAPNHTSPFCDAGRARERQRIVLRRMVATGVLDATQATEAERLDVRVRLASDDEDIGVTASAASVATSSVATAPGMALTTTMDLPLQRAATLALREHLERYAHRRGEHRGPRFVIPIAALDMWREQLTALRTTVHSWSAPPPLVYDLRSLSDRRSPDALCTAGGTILRKATPKGQASGIVFAHAADGAHVDLGDFTGVLAPPSYAWTKQQITAVVPIGAVVDVVLPDTLPERGGTIPVMLVPRPKVEGAVVAIDPRSGAVRAAVGGYEYTRGDFHRVLRGARPIGSTAKPFVYAAAFAAGTTTPLTPMQDVPLTFIDPWSGDVWEPKNWYVGFHGDMLAYEALARSVNTVAVQVLLGTTAARTAAFVTAFHPVQQLPAVPSIALGTFAWTPLELAGAYLPLARGGTTVPIRWLDAVTRSGETSVVPQEASRPLLAPQFAATLDWMLRQGVRLPDGTGHQLDALGLTIRAKTGTTNDARDAWTVAYTPELLVVAWVGYDVPASLTYGSRQESSTTLAVPIVHAVFHAAKDLGNLGLMPTAEPVLEQSSLTSFAAHGAPRTFTDALREKEEG
ncbi:MAG: transglycosylase domain-containing protein [bacterium]|nr:transglycosylase domain-containing protein [bacterium]